MYIYGLALKEVEKKIDIIRYDYEYFNKYDSIDHVMTRIKSPESILNCQFLRMFYLQHLHLKQELEKDIYIYF